MTENNKGRKRQASLGDLIISTAKLCLSAPLPHLTPHMFFSPTSYILHDVDRESVRGLVILWDLRDERRTYMWKEDRNIPKPWGKTRVWRHRGLTWRPMWLKLRDKRGWWEEMTPERRAEVWLCKMIVPKVLLNCQVVQWLPEEGRLCKRILKRGDYRCWR